MYDGVGVAVGGVVVGADEVGVAVGGVVVGADGVDVAVGGTVGVGVALRGPGMM